MKPEKVKPIAWSNISVLYNNTGENYSLIWGSYQGEKLLGVRWNGENNNRGYPGQGNQPTWYIEPEFLTLTILNEILRIATDKSQDIYLKRIRKAIEEFNN
jgi:hypothetical protein